MSDRAGGLFTTADPARGGAAAHRDPNAALHRFRRRRRPAARAGEELRRGGRGRLRRGLHVPARGDPPQRQRCLPRVPSVPRPRHRRGSPASPRAGTAPRGHRFAFVGHRACQCAVILRVVEPHLQRPTRSIFFYLISSSHLHLHHKYQHHDDNDPTHPRSPRAGIRAPRRAAGQTRSHLRPGIARGGPARRLDDHAGGRGRQRRGSAHLAGTGSPGLGELQAGACHGAMEFGAAAAGGCVN